MIISEEEKNRILGLHSNSRNVNGSLINEQYTWAGPVDVTDELINRGQVGMSDDVRRWHGQSDSVKNTWFCLDGRNYRDYGIDEPTFDRFNWLWSGIEGGVTSWGTNEEQVYHALSSEGPDGGDIKSSFAGKGKIIFTVGFFIITPISIKFPVSYNTSKSIVLKVSTSSTKLIPCLYPSLSSKDFKKLVTDSFPICDQLSYDVILNPSLSK